MKLALGQINPIVGDLQGNVQKIIDLIDEVREEKVDLFIFPELIITGYPPEDLLLKPRFIEDNLAELKKVIAASKGTALYLGFVDRKGRDLYNAGAFIVDDRLKTVYRKMNLPNYSVFDEKRYFTEGEMPVAVSYQGKKIGLGICEDIWVEKTPYPKGLDLVLNINASPYHVGKVAEREKLLRKKAKNLKATIVYVNQVGGQDELVFDGGSLVVNPKGKIVAAGDQFREELLIYELGKDSMTHQWLEERQEIYSALVMGVKDYINKNGFSEVVIGLSGGIDSALTLAVAVDALGQERVHAIFMPSQYTAGQSYQDAKKVAENLGVELANIPISGVYEAYLSKLQPNFKGQPANIAEENLQARIRGNYLMALSNKFNWLVLATGNKSEMSTGYCTIYGDMAGGFAVLKDVPKTLVYQLADWRNRGKKIIPQTIIDRQPTAELRPNQTDQETLPPYDLLDKIMALYVEKNLSFKEIVARGFARETVAKVLKLIDRSEYKRRQAPPGPRITARAFGKDWRLPITNKYYSA